MEEDKKNYPTTGEEFLTGIMRLAALSADLYNSLLYVGSVKLTNEERSALIRSLAVPNSPGRHYREVIDDILSYLDPKEVENVLTHLGSYDVGDPVEYLEKLRSDYTELNRVLMDGIDRVSESLTLLSAKLDEMAFTKGVDDGRKRN